MINFKPIELKSKKELLEYIALPPSTQPKSVTNKNNLYQKKMEEIHYTRNPKP